MLSLLTTPQAPEHDQSHNHLAHTNRNTAFPAPSPNDTIYDFTIFNFLFFLNPLVAALVLDKQTVPV